MFQLFVLFLNKILIERNIHLVTNPSSSSESISVGCRYRRVFYHPPTRSSTSSLNLVCFLTLPMNIKSNQVYLYTAYFENDSGVFTVRKQYKNKTNKKRNYVKIKFRNNYNFVETVTIHLLLQFMLFVTIYCNLLNAKCGFCTDLHISISILMAVIPISLAYFP